MKNNQHISYKTIAAFLDTQANKGSKFFGYAGLCTGMVLLLTAAQMFININYLIKEKNTRKDGFDFISVTKTVTNENMMKDNRFNEADLQELKQQKFIDDAAPLISNQFRVKASAGNIIPFSTDLFLEAIQSDFIDTVPDNFDWKPGDINVPIVFSADYLEMYNVFAPSQDLPQMSESTISSLTIILECHGPGGIENFRGNIVAVTNRISSVLVPQSFLQWANKRYGNAENVPAARVYLKTKDANSTELLNFIDAKKYHLNKDKTKFGRIKQVLEGVITALAGFAVVVIILAMLLFSFYLQLIIERSRQNLILLLTLGYSPEWLTKTLAKKWTPVYFTIMLIATALTSAFQLLFVQKMNNRAELSHTLHPVVFALALLILMLSILINYRMIKKMLYKL